MPLPNMPSALGGAHPERSPLVPLTDGVRVATVRDVRREIMWHRVRKIFWLVTLALTLAGIGRLFADTVSKPMRTFGLGELRTVMTSPDGNHLATAGQSGAFLWDPAAATVRHRLEAHTGFVSVLAFSPDSRALLTAGRDEVIHCWDTDSGALIRSYIGHSGEITGVFFAPKGDTFVSCSLDGTTRVWDFETGAQLHSLVVTGTWINAVAFAPDGKHVATVANLPNAVVGLWNVAQEAQIRTFTGHVGQVWAIQFLPNGNLATGGDDRFVRIWDTATGNQIRALTGATNVILNLSFATNNALLIAGTQNGNIHAWNPDSGALVHSLLVPFSFTVSPSSQQPQVFTGGADELAQRVDLASGTVLQRYEGHSSSTTLSVSFSPDEQFVAVGGTEKFVRIWNATNGALVRALDGHPAGTYAATFSPDGTRLLTTKGLPQAAARLWTLASGTVEKEFLGHTSWLLTAAFSPNGERLITAGIDQTVRIWNVQTSTQQWSFTGHSGWVRSAAFAPNNRWAASGGDDLTARIWDTQTGQLLHTFANHAAPVKAVAFSPDGTEFLTLSDAGEVKIWNPVDGSFKREFQVPGGFVNAAAFSQDGQFILTGEGWPFMVARLWDSQTGELLRVFAGNTSPVESVAISPSGRMILTGADTTKLWSIADLAARLRVKRKGSGMELSWGTGMLQKAPNPNGPWEDLTAATSPHEVSAAEAAEFYRVLVHH